MKKQQPREIHIFLRCCLLLDPFFGSRFIAWSEVNSVAQQTRGDNEIRKKHSVMAAIYTKVDGKYLPEKLLFSVIYSGKAKIAHSFYGLSTHEMSHLIYSRISNERTIVTRWVCKAASYLSYLFTILFTHFISFPAILSVPFTPWRQSEFMCGAEKRKYFLIFVCNFRGSNESSYVFLLLLSVYGIGLTHRKNLFSYSRVYAPRQNLMYTSALPSRQT